MEIIKNFLTGLVIFTIILGILFGIIAVITFIAKHLMMTVLYLLLVVVAVVILRAIYGLGKDFREDRKRK